MRKLLTKTFFEKSALKVAEGLLGKYLCMRRRGKSLRLLITETEAYDGFRDKASHAHRGKTARNSPMFGEAGRWYVYFTYGMHWMLNIVAGPANYPAAVLIRCGIPDFPSKRLARHGYFSAKKFLVLAPSRSQGLARHLPENAFLSASRRNVLTDFAQADGTSRAIRQQANMRVRQNNAPVSLNGPAKLTKFMKINKKFNNLPANGKTGLWIEDRDMKIPKKNIKKAARVGVDYAGEWANKKYRFILKQ